MIDINERVSALSPAKQALLALRQNKRLAQRRASRLSFSQQRLWFAHQLEPDSAAYNIPGAVRLRGRLNLTALRQSLQEIARRHEVLRTRFEERDGQPVQVIEQAAEVSLPVWNISDVDEEGREARVRQIAGREAARAFDLERGPVWRAALVRMSADDHVLLFCLHHVASDAWSTVVLISEMTSLYDAFQRGEKSPLRELEIQYADYAAWQAEWLEGEALTKQVEYWKEQLKGAPPVLELVTDRARPAVQSYRGAIERFELSGPLSESLKQISRREGVTLFMTLQAAFDALLHLTTGQDDIIIGTSIANRTHLQTEKLVGCFINLLPLRTILSGNPSFRMLLAKVREVTLGAFSHQDIPFEKLVEFLQPERDLRYSPLFQVLFEYRDEPASRLELPGLSFSFCEPNRATAKFDLTLFMMQGRERIGGFFEYRTDLYDPCTIRRMIEQFQELLQNIAGDPRKDLMSLSPASEREKNKIVSDFNEDMDF